MPGAVHQSAAMSKAGLVPASRGLQCEGKAEPGHRTGWTLRHTGHIQGRLVRLGWVSGPWKLCDR